jgi:putative pre-16S rRNA nuclease
MLLRPSGVSCPGSRPARAWPVPVSQLPFRQGVRLAVDVGTVRIGVARSDPGGVLATPLTVLASGPGAKAALARAELARMAASEGAIEVIVGLPTSLSGREGVAAHSAREFAADLAGRLAPIPVRLVDERFTTTEAHDALRRSGRDARARRHVVDAAAAAVLLQAALDAERATGRPAGQLVPARDEGPVRAAGPARGGGSAPGGSPAWGGSQDGGGGQARGGNPARDGGSARNGVAG